ncbi:hypothetical protein BGZ73_006475 [Actinomortierella ambigua]|nr:hypothetical protein BGZ73_006475 [Actinomortierella ambigua]
MKAIISANSLKTFQIVLNCLNKIGEDITIEARRDSLKLSTLNLTRTCFGTFTFSTAFFESYGWNTEARSILVDQQGEFVRCKLAAKMVYKQGGAKTHKLRYQMCESEPQVKYDKSQCSNHWALASSTLMGSLEHFSSKVEEVVMECKNESITFKSVKDENEGATTIVDAKAAEEMAAAQVQATVNNDDDDGFGAEWELSQADNAFLESEAAWGSLMDVDTPPAAAGPSQASGIGAAYLTASTQGNSQAVNEQGENEDDDAIVEERSRSRKRVKAMFRGDD